MRKQRDWNCRRVTLVAVAWVAYLLPLPTDAQLTTAPSAIDAEDRAYFEELIQKIEPNRVGKPDRLPQYMRWFQSQMINDVRIFAFDVRVKWSDDAVELTGFVEFEETHADLVNFFRSLGFDRIEDRIEVLPSDNLGDERFGFVTAPHSLCYDRPDGSRENVTDCLLGDPIFLLTEAVNGFFLCHTAEGYLGYIDGTDVHRVDAAEFRQHQSGPRVRVLEDHKTEGQTLLPVGARLKMIGSNGDQVVVRLPTDQIVSMPADRCELLDDKADPRVDRVIRNGRRLLGTKYVWGGKSSAGIDCSGLVQIAFAAEGINLPRDSNQQVYLGRLTATRWYRDGMRRGDTLYFLGRHGKIIHTAIYLGDGQYLESAGRGVRISSLDPDDPNFDARRSKKFAFAKRLLD